MNERDVAVEAARAAGAILMDAAERVVRVEHKGAVDLVTEVDRACEEAVRAVLGRHLPDIPVLGEEEGGAWHAPTRWIVDPLDGTTNFVHGFPWYCVSIGLEVDGERHTGVLYEPVRDRLYTAQRGKGAYCDGQRLRVSDCRDLRRALVATGFPYDRTTRAAEYIAPVERVLAAAQGLRRAGSAALDLAMVAAGQLDAYWEPRLGPWDLAAGALLVTEAGGRLTAVDGGALHPRDPAPLATNGWLHDAMLAALAG